MATQASDLTGNEITRFRIRTLMAAVKLEKKGMTRRGASAKSILIQQLDLPTRSTHDEVLEAARKILEEWSISNDLDDR